MAILITGGTGFVGIQLARQLVDRGETVVLFDNNPREEAIEPVRNRVEIVRGNLAVMSEVLNAVRGRNIRSIFHLGAMLSIPSDENPWAAYQVNADGTMHVFEAARIFGVEKVIYSSTMGMYAGTVGVIDETVAASPESMYGATKLFSEVLGRFYHKKFGVDFRAVRFCTVVGMGAKTKHMSQYMGWMIERSLEGEPFEVWVTEDTRNACLYYKDAVRSLLTLHDAPAGDIKTRVYNLAGTASTAGEEVQIVKKHIPGARLTFKPDPVAMALLGNGIGVGDESAARKEWGWESEYDLEAMIVDFKKEFESIRRERASR